MSESIQVPINETEARYIIEALTNKLSDLNIRDQLFGLSKKNQDEKYLATNIRKKFQIMFSEVMKNESNRSDEI